MRYQLPSKQAILKVIGWTLHSTSIPRYRDSGLKTFKRLKKNYPENQWEFREYRVNIHTADPRTGICTDWEEEEGWSIWYK